MDIGVAGGSYRSADGRASVQDAVNCYPIVIEAAGRSQYVQVPTPGVVSVLTGLDGECRAMLYLDALIYGVWGEKLYQWDGTGSALEIGTIPGDGRLAFDYSPTHLVFVNNLLDAWAYDIPGATLAEVTDADLPPVSDVTYLDGYFIYAMAGDRRFYISALNDPFSIEGTDFAAKEGDANPLRATVANHGELVLLGHTHIEYWRNVGSGLFAFQPQQGTETDRGCGARDSVVELNNTVFFLGDDRVVYRIVGYQPVRVSNHAIEAILQAMSAEQIEAAYAVGYDEGGHYHYALTAGDYTLVFDQTSSALAQQSLWHERRSHRAGESLRSVQPWRCAFIVDAFGQDYVGDLHDGALGVLSSAVHDEYGLPMRSQRTLAPIAHEGDHVAHQRLELRVREGIGTATVPAYVELEWSNDGGRTWSDPRRRSMGLRGQYSVRCIWRRLGRSVDRIYRFSATNAPGFAWVSAVLDAEPQV